jgi:hypothetical protein
VIRRQGAFRTHDKNQRLSRKRRKETAHGAHASSRLLIRDPDCGAHESKVLSPLRLVKPELDAIQPMRPR